MGAPLSKKYLKKLEEAKYIVTVKDGIDKEKPEKEFTMSVYDIKNNEYWSEEKIASRGIQSFQDFNDAIETINWNLNGDTSRCFHRWVMTTVAEIYVID